MSILEYLVLRPGRHRLALFVPARLQARSSRPLSCFVSVSICPKQTSQREREREKEVKQDNKKHNKLTADNRQCLHSIDRRQWARPLVLHTANKTPAQVSQAAQMRSSTRAEASPKPFESRHFSVRRDIRTPLSLYCQSSNQASILNSCLLLEETLTSFKRDV